MDNNLDYQLQDTIRTYYFNIFSQLLEFCMEYDKDKLNEFPEINSFEKTQKYLDLSLVCPEIKNELSDFNKLICEIKQYSLNQNFKPEELASVVLGNQPPSLEQVLMPINKEFFNIIEEEN